MEKTYDVDYFIAKFEAIPEELWWVGKYLNPSNPFQRCALGHCHKAEDVYRRDLTERIAFSALMPTNVACIAEINDGRDDRYQQPTPKARILAALQDIKRKQYPQLTHPPVTAEQVIEELEGVVV